MRKHSFSLSSINLTEGSISSCDAVILATDHDTFDYELIKANAKILIDTRGRYSPSEKIVRA